MNHKCDKILSFWGHCGAGHEMTAMGFLTTNVQSFKNRGLCSCIFNFFFFCLPRKTINDFPQPQGRGEADQGKKRKAPTQKKEKKRQKRRGKWVNP